LVKLFHFISVLLLITTELMSHTADEENQWTANKENQWPHSFIWESNLFCEEVMESGWFMPRPLLHAPTGYGSDEQCDAAEMRQLLEEIEQQVASS
jgi:hypothetical protein